MVSFGFSLSDIFTTIEKANQIYEKCFTRALGADVQYLEFGRQIKSLSENLTQLKNVFERRPQVPRWHRPDHDRDRDLGPTLPKLTGNFMLTLDDCEKLLKEHSRFQRNRAGFVDNVHWWLGGTEARVKTLTERVHFHAVKILFIAKPVELELQLDNNELLHEIQGTVDGLETLLAAQYQPDPRPLPYALPSVPSHLKSRFVDALSINQPASFQRLADFPLKEGWDALIIHFFEESTVNFISGEYENQKIPHETQYLNLVKSRWILQMIRESSHFKEAGPGSLWARCIKKSEMSIIKEYKRIQSGRLVAPEDDVISRLPETCFATWAVDQVTARLPVLTDERPSEEKILEIALPKPLGTRKLALTIFRKDDNELRIVCTTTDEQNEAFRESEGFNINTHFTRFIPVYAVPKSDNSVVTNNVIFCNSQGKAVLEYSLECLDDVIQLQRAVLGFKVNFDGVEAHWSTYRSKIKEAQEMGSGRVQIWQAKPFPQISSTIEKPTSPTSSTYVRSQTSNVATTKSTMVSGGHASAISGSGVTALAFSEPEFPVIVIYTLYKEKYTFLHLRLDKSVFINGNACDCRNPSKCCRKVVIESKAKTIDFRRLCALDEKFEGLNTWDLARLGLPRHPGFGDLEPLTKTKYICLKFSGMKEKEAFRAKFDEVVELRDLDCEKYYKALESVERRANQRDRPTSNGSLQS